MIVWLVVLLFAWATLVAPFVGDVLDRHRRDRAEVERLGRVRYPTSAPRFTRDDPSPRPRKRTAA